MIQCGSDHHHEHLLNSDRDYQSRYLNFQSKYVERMKHSRRDVRRSAPVYTIPVVVHIIHAGAPLGSDANPTDETITSIVNEASQRFRHAHSGAATYANPNYGADTEIELCLAKNDPNGNYTSGVTRHYDPANAVGAYGDIADALNTHAWDKSKYCNLYIVTQLTNASGVYMGGYDFTIYDSPAFWSGLIAHEIGHYFNLRHTFYRGCSNNNCLQDGDEVCDTPPKETSGFNGGSCAGPTNTCTTDDDDQSINNPYRPVANGGLGDQPDMFANYMDYTGSCWDSFTEGQKTRMRTVIETYRTALANNSAACNGSSPALDAGIVNVTINQADVCQASFTPSVTFKNYGTSTLTSIGVIVSINGSPSGTTHWSGSLATGHTATISLATPVTLSIGTHVLSFKTDQPNGGSDLNQYNDTEYRPVQYLGGTSCQTFNACTAFNPNTASGPGNNTVINVSASYPASSNDVQICITTEGDVGWSQEVFEVFDESSVSRGYTNFHSQDCNGPTPQFCFIATAADYNAWRANGTITVTLSPVSAQINPTLCGVNQGCVSINIPQNANCNAVVTLNGIITSGLYEASNYLEAGGMINNAHSVILGANNYTTLETGFEVQQGGILQIMNVGCN